MKAGAHLFVVRPCQRLSSKREERLSSKRKEGYQYFGVQVQLVTLLSAFRLMSNV